MPGLKQIHVNAPLTNYSVKWRSPAFVAEKLFPQLKVTKKSDVYFVYGKEQYNIYETRRGNRSASNRIEWSVSDDTYNCVKDSLSTLVTDEEYENVDSPIQLDIDSMEFVQETLDRALEFRAAQMATTSGNYLAANVMAPATKWDLANSTPLDDINGMKQAILTASEVVPNTIIIPQPVALKLARNSQVIEERKYTDGNLVEDDDLPKKLLGMNVVIAGAVYNTAKPGKNAQTMANIWGKNVILAYVSPRPKIKDLSFGVTFRQDRYVRKWRDDEVEGNVIECNDITDVKIIANGCGALCQNVIS